MTDFIWPSDVARAENDELNRVCEYLEEVLNERDALAARYAALADEVRAMIQDSDGLAGYHLNGEVACWSELEVGHLLSEPEDLGEKVLARLKAEWQAEAVSEYAFHYLGGHEQELAEIYAGKLRRQAEETQP